MVTRSVTLPASLEAKAVERFDGAKSTEALRQAIRAGVKSGERQREDHEIIRKLVDVLHAREL